jgi:hypothetical protein
LTPLSPATVEVDDVVDDDDVETDEQEVEPAVVALLQVAQMVEPAVAEYVPVGQIVNPVAALETITPPIVEA